MAAGCGFPVVVKSPIGPLSLDLSSVRLRLKTRPITRRQSLDDSNSSDQNWPVERQPKSTCAPGHVQDRATSFVQSSLVSPQHFWCWSRQRILRYSAAHWREPRRAGLRLDLENRA